MSIESCVYFTIPKVPWGPPEGEGSTPITINNVMLLYNPLDHLHVCSHIMCKIVLSATICVLTPSLLIVHPTVLVIVFDLLFVSHEATSSSSATDWLGGGRTTTESDGQVCGAVRQFPLVYRLSTHLQ